VKEGNWIFVEYVNIPVTGNAGHRVLFKRVICLQTNPYVNMLCKRWFNNGIDSFHFRIL